MDHPPVSSQVPLSVVLAPGDEPKPSVYQLPQHCSPDRRRARLATLALQRSRYELLLDAPTEHDGEKFWLPPRAKTLPEGERFGPAKFTSLAAHKLVASLSAKLATVTSPFGRTRSEAGYARLLGLIAGPPGVLGRWRSDDEFARQRLSGTNPLQLLRHDPSRHAPVPDALLTAADGALAELGAGVTRKRLDDAGRLFLTDHRDLAHPIIQQGVGAGYRLSAPVCLYFTDDAGKLRPLAVMLSPDDPQIHTAAGKPLDWLHARCHVQASDGAYHEGPHHLLGTHLVSEVFAIVTARQLHPHHPLHQLLAPHFLFNLAINDKARGDLLAPEGPIDLAVASGVGGVLNLIRMHWGKWSFWDHCPRRDLELRGVADPATLESYWYRDDALCIFTAIEEYVGGIVACWYHSDDDVRADAELAAWAAELSDPKGGAIPGFDAKIETRELLRKVLAQVIFRASAAHAAVNNGQFARYGWVPNSPGALHALPTELRGRDLTEKAFWAAMPDRRRSLAQICMVWVLSSPTFYSLVRTGDVPAFDADFTPAANRAAGLFRRRLLEISASIRARNDDLVRRALVPYADMDPYNVSRSTET